MPSIKRMLVLLFATAAIVLVSSSTAWAARVNINATVNAQLVAISCSTSTVSFGAMGSNDYKTSGSILVTNTGNVPVKLTYSGWNGTGPSGSTLTLVNDVPYFHDNEYRMDLVYQYSPTGEVRAPFVNGTTSTWPQDPTLAVNGDVKFKLWLAIGPVTTLGAYTMPLAIDAYAP